MGGWLSGVGGGCCSGESGVGCRVGTQSLDAAWADKVGVPVVQPAESAASEVDPAADVAPHRLVSFSHSEGAVGAEEGRSGVGLDAGHE